MKWLCTDRRQNTYIFHQNCHHILWPPPTCISPAVISGVGYALKWDTSYTCTSRIVCQKVTCIQKPLTDCEVLLCITVYIA